MLKKISAILLLFLYLPSVIGVQMCAHYCGGELQSVSVYTQADEDLCCGTHAKHNCCNDESKIIKVKDSHKNPELKVFSFDVTDELPATLYAISGNLAQVHISLDVPQAFVEPPDIITPPLFIYYCSFLI